MTTGKFSYLCHTLYIYVMSPSLYKGIRTVQQCLSWENFTIHCATEVSDKCIEFYSIYSIENITLILYVYYVICSVIYYAGSTLLTSI